MGECRVRINCLGRLRESLLSTGPSSLSWVTLLSADTAVRQLSESIERELVERLIATNTKSGGSTKSCSCSDDQKSRGVACACSNATSTYTVASFGLPSTISPRLALYNLTMSPPQNLTGIIQNNPHLTGPASITLQKLGLFPSAQLGICYDDDDAMKRGLDLGEDIDVGSLLRGGGGEKGAERGGQLSDEGEYNRTRKLCTDSSRAMVQLTGSSMSIGGNDEMGDGYFRPKPSHIMAAVAERDSNLDEAAVDPSIGATERSRKAQARRQMELQRKKRLDDTIQRIDASAAKKKGGSNARISSQVKRMLIKSRAVGKKSLREEDRFYVEVIFVDDTTSRDKSGSDASSFRFFSRMKTAGHVASQSLEGMPSEDSSLELLLLVPVADQLIYRRLPNLVTLQEADDRGFLKPFDRVIVRKYSLAHDKPTDSIVETKEYDANARRGRQESSPKELDTSPQSSPGVASAKCGNNSVLYDLLTQAMDAAVETKSAKGKRGTKKQKKSATLEKVRHMLIKSKAKGPKNLKDSDKFFLEVAVVEVTETSDSEREVLCTVPPTAHFFNRMAFANVLNDNEDEDKVTTEILVRCPKDLTTYHSLDQAMRLCDAERMSKLEQFALCIVLKRM